MLGNSADAASYSQLATQIKDAFNHEFLDAKTGNYANGTQTANALPLFLDMVPKDQRGAVAGNLNNDILYRHDTHLTTGFIGVRYLMPVLTQLQHSDLAYDLAVQTTFPSWGYMADEWRHDSLGTLAEQDRTFDEFPRSPHDGKRGCLVL